MRGLQRARWVVGAATFAMIATACGGGSDSSSSAPTTGGAAAATGSTGGGGGGGGTFSVQIAEPQYLVPTNTNETEGSQVLSALFTGLVKHNVDTNAPEMAHAESIETTDNKTYTVKLKPGWKFHNGEDVTAQSYVDAWNYGALNSNAQNNSYFFSNFQGYADVSPTDENTDDDKVPPAKAQTMSGLKVVSPTEFTITLSEPFTGFPTVLGYTAFYPMPKAAYTDIKAYEQAPIGNGPFKMKGTWEHDVKLDVEKFADYKGSSPAKAEGVNFKIYQKQETAYTDLQANELDVLPMIAPDQISSARTQLGDRFIEDVSSGFGFLGIPAGDPKFKNVKVRQAVSRAINREEITSTVFNGARKPATAFVSPIVPGYRDGSCGEACVFDPAAAKQLLQEGGGIPGNEMTLTYNADGGHQSWIDAICNQVQTNLGVKCTGVPKDKFATVLNDLDKAKTSKQGFGPFRLGWIMDYPLMENYLGPLYSSEGSSNYYGYANKQFDTLVAQGRSAATEQEAIAKWQQAEDILAKDFPVIPIFTYVTVAGRSENVSNVKVDAFDRVDVANVQVTRS